MSVDFFQFDGIFGLLKATLSVGKIIKLVNQAVGGESLRKPTFLAKTLSFGGTENGSVISIGPAEVYFTMLALKFNVLVEVFFT